MKLRKVKKFVKRCLREFGWKVSSVHGRTFVISEPKNKCRIYAPFIVVSEDHKNLNKHIAEGQKPLYIWKAEYKAKKDKLKKRLLPDSGNPADDYTWFEDVDDEGYCYTVYAMMNTRKVGIFITDYGVSVDCKNGKGGFFTDITPNKLFPNQKSLTLDQISTILDKIDRREHESTPYSGDFMKKMRNKWEIEVKGKDITE